MNGGRGPFFNFSSASGNQEPLPLISRHAIPPSPILHTYILPTLPPFSLHHKLKLLRKHTIMSSRESFKSFLQSWLDGLDDIVNRLKAATVDKLHESDRHDLILAFMEHQELLFSAKGSLASRDPVLGAYLPWINSFCRALQWYGGWRPTAAFRLAEVSKVVPPEQVAAIEAMRVATKEEEAAVEQEKSRLEVGVIRAFTNGRDISSMETTIKGVMESVVVAADMIRMDAIRRVLGLLQLEEAISYLLLLGKMEANFYAMDHEEY